MKKLNKILSSFLVLCILWGVCPWTQMISHAAVTIVTLRTMSFSEGILQLAWINVSGTQSVKVEYHKPPDQTSSVIINQTDNIVSIPNLSNDIIYDIKIEIYDELNGGGNLIGSGFTYFLPRMSFYSTLMQQERYAIPGGGFETGIEPRMNLKWTVPKVWNGDTGTFNYVTQGDSIAYIKNQINSVYNLGLTLNKVDFKINISTSFATLNSGSSQASINIDYDGAAYGSWLSGIPGTIAEVNGIDANGQMNFNVLGRANELADLPVSDEDDVLPDRDLLAGTIYYMNIRMIFKDSDGATVNAVSVGAPQNMNCSLLMGTNAYTYTPVRFQLTRDALENIYVKVYKVNSGDLSLPRLFYEVQSSDDPSIPGDWPIKKSFDDSFFAEGTDYTINVITGVNPENTIYYKVVVKTESTSDRLESSYLPYSIAEDTSKSPVPKNVSVISSEYVTRTVEVNGEDILQKSSDITISWEKPSNWDEIVANNNPNNDVVFHIDLNTYFTDQNQPAELTGDGIQYGEYIPKYRRMVSFSSKQVTVSGNYLRYKIEGFELFKGIFFTGLDGDENPEFIVEDLPNADNYPTFLLPNKTYYLQLYTTSGADRYTTDEEKMSDKSVIISFTTKSGIEMEVPLAKGLKITKNIASILGAQEDITNNLELEFGKIDINWNNYSSDPDIEKSVVYDVYMSNRSETNSFIYIGSTNDPDGDVGFEGADDPQAAVIRAAISNFSSGTLAYSVFGEKLKPNTTYYFAVKTRLLIGNYQVKSSRLTTAVAATTVKGIYEEPDASAKLPIAPSDFAIAKDIKGNDIIGDTYVTFEWLSQEDNVIYQIACSGEKLNQRNEVQVSVSDSVYRSFNSVFGEILLDPADVNSSSGFRYNASSRICKYSINTWLQPNRLYYFSIKAIYKNDTGKFSEWISIPVTTLMIEGPTMLTVIDDAEIGFYWSDNDVNATEEDFSLYIKKSDEKVYKKVSKTNYHISRDGIYFFGRITGLEFLTTYAVKVVKGVSETFVAEKSNLTTRDKYHEIEVRWKGNRNFTYDIAIKSLGISDYINLTDLELKSWNNYNGAVLPYYIEENSKLLGSGYAYYYARIQKMPVQLANGKIEGRSLSSNTKYYVKVRAVNIEPLDTTIISYSKYIGPVIKRTEYYEPDFEENEELINKKDTILTKVSSWSQNYFWRVGLKDTSKKQILLKSDKVINLISTQNDSSFVVDLSSIGSITTTDILYIPGDILKEIKLRNKSLVIKTIGASFTIRPDSLDIDKCVELQNIKKDTGVVDLFVKMQIKNDTKSSVKLPKGAKEGSKVYTLDVVAQGSAKTYEQLKTMFDDKLNNKEEGILYTTINDLLSATPADSISKKSASQIVADIETELSTYILSVIGGKGTGATIRKSETIKAFTSPILVNITLNNTSYELRQPYVYFSGYTAWQKVTNNVLESSTGIGINTMYPGKYVLLVTAVLEDIPGDFAGKEQIKIFASKYEITDIFGPMKSFVPDEALKTNEIVLLFEKIMGQKTKEPGLSIKEKANNYGIGVLIRKNSDANDVERQEAAYVFLKIFCDKTGVTLEGLTSKGRISINDESEIKKEFYKAVFMAEDFKLLQLDEKGNIEPQLPITRVDAIDGLVKVLKLTGDL